ncbi:MAG: hypothetical protein WA775_09685 [Psychroserpens sp.]|uniref:hypothetical protein n=1 Tax=Psychroserpens sp. TaxID=2020870 RepID=UPI003C7842B6
MKNIYKLLVFSLLLMFSCEVETLQPNNSLLHSQNDQLQNNAEDEDECETLFAKAPDSISTCFLDDGFNRWGWTIGPIESGGYSFELYSGAGQCDLEKGTLVGNLNITYNQEIGTADIEFVMFEDYVLNETHLYIGNEPYPTGSNGKLTVAPGQFPYQHELDSVENDVYTINGLSGEIYIIAHGVVCNDDEDDDGGGAF